jgi:flagellar biosynthesis/type III secretory pathway protein FliH
LIQFERELAELTPEEKEATMEIMTSWERKGRDEGLQEGLQQGIQQGVRQGVHLGKEELLAMQLEQRFSTLPEDITARLDRLSSEQLNDLGLALYRFDRLADLEDWLARQS